MRLILTLVALTLVAPTFVTASTEEPADAIGVTIVRASALGTHIVWSPVPGAVVYEVYRGPTPEDLQLIAVTMVTEYTDQDAPAITEDVWYEVVTRASQPGSGDDPGPMRGRCVAMRSSGFAVTIANCMPSSAPVSHWLPQL